MSGWQVWSDERAEPPLRRATIELGGVALLLAGWIAALSWFAGPPDLARLPVWPGWEAFGAMASSRTAPLDGVLQITVVVQWAIAIGLVAWLGLSVVVELLLAIVERGPAQGSAWLRSTRAVVRQASFPLVHQPGGAPFRAAARCPPTQPRVCPGDGSRMRSYGPPCSASMSGPAARSVWRALYDDCAAPSSSSAPPRSPTSTACPCHPTWSVSSRIFIRGSMRVGIDHLMRARLYRLGRPETHDVD